ncbi:MAG: cupin domain-containing protein [Kofleriaceae bacterium]|nr:cupin domain-containing protein [Kofleriaceae bacterium]
MPALVMVALAIGAASCGSGAAATPRSTGPSAAGSANAPGAVATAASDAKRDAARDAEQLAAVEFAMNQLDEGSQMCWASAAAVDGFEIAGGLKFHVDVAAQRSVATVLDDDIKNVRLRECMVKLLSDFRWAPPLFGEGVELPFVFRAPVRQSVIDRRLVPRLSVGASGTAPAVAVLLDAQNTGNADASLFDVVIPAGASTGDRVAARPELWYFFTAATVTLPGQVMQVAAGDVVWLPGNTVRNIAATHEVRAVLLLAPGGVEGSARSGALATPMAPLLLPSPGSGSRPTTNPNATNPSARKQPAAGSKPIKFAATAATALALPQGRVTIIAADANMPASVTLLEFAAGATLAAHHHADATEVVYVLAGSAVLTVDGVTIEIHANSVMQFPKGVVHSASITQAMRALVFYTPAGSEQRFKTKVSSP